MTHQSSGDSVVVALDVARTRPRLLDLFGGAGGCSVGYHRAGFAVVGVDIARHDDYPFPMYVADALDVLDDMLKHGDGTIYDGIDFAAIHASPPCQAYTTMSNRWRGAGGKADAHVELIHEVRDRLLATGLPYVIENVPGAKRDMRSPLTLTGGMFGLGVHRPRLFESNVLLMVPPKERPPADALGVYGKAHDGRRLFTRADGSIQRAAGSLEEAQAAMGIDWMTWDDLREAVPPAYTEWIGLQLARAIDNAEVVA